MVIPSTTRKISLLTCYSPIVVEKKQTQFSRGLTCKFAIDNPENFDNKKKCKNSAATFSFGVLFCCIFLFADSFCQNHDFNILLLRSKVSSKITERQKKHRDHTNTVDGRNPAPPGMVLKPCTSWLNYQPQLVSERRISSIHQQYHPLDSNPSKCSKEQSSGSLPDQLSPHSEPWKTDQKTNDLNTHLGPLQYYDPLHEIQGIF